MPQEKFVAVDSLPTADWLHPTRFRAQELPTHSVVREHGETEESGGIPLENSVSCGDLTFRCGIVAEAGQVGFSPAIRKTRVRIVSLVGGRPGVRLG